VAGEEQVELPEDLILPDDMKQAPVVDGELPGDMILPDDMELPKDVEAPEESFAHKAAETVQEASDVYTDVVGWAKEKGPEIAANYEKMKERDPAMGAVLDYGVEPAVKGAWEVLSKTGDVIDRAVGTGIFTMSKGLTWAGEKINALPEGSVERFRKVEEAINARNAEDGIPPESWKADMLPFSVSRESFHAVKDKLDGYANELKKGDKDSQDWAKVVEGLSTTVATGVSLGASLLTDPLMYTKFGALTKLGVEAEKKGQLVKSVAAQIREGQRSGMTIKGLGEIGIMKTPSAKFMQNIEEVGAKLSQTSIGRGIRHLTTYTGWKGVDTVGDLVSIDHHNTDLVATKIMNAHYSMAVDMGFDYANKDVRGMLYKVFDNPTWAEKNLPENFVKKAKALKSSLDDMLKAEVDEAAKSGVMIQEFAPMTIKNLPDDEWSHLLQNNEEWGKLKGMNKAKTIQEQKAIVTKHFGQSPLKSLGYSENYVPRNANLSEKQTLMAKNILEEVDDVEDFLNEAVPVEARRIQPANFSKKRLPYTREEVNSIIEQRTGISNYFHDDIVRAYGEKIKEVRSTVTNKKAIDTLLTEFGGARSAGDWVAVKNAAKKRIEAAKILGIDVDPNDIRLANVNISTLGKIDGEVAGKIGSTLKYYGEQYKDLDRMHLPSEVADFVNGLYKVPTAVGIEKFASEYNKTWKQLLFFNPGYILRNAYESSARSIALGVSPKEWSKATAATLFNKGSYAPFKKEFETLSEGLHMLKSEGKPIAGRLESYGKIHLQKMSKEFMKNNPQSRILEILHESSRTGKWEAFSKYMKHQARNPSDNPLFQASKWANHKGENIPKIAYFSKLREAGYSPKAAMMKVNRAFPNYSITRNAVRKTTNWAAPFFGYSVKNAEQFAGLLAQSPGQVLAFAPGGHIEKAISQWSGWSPDTLDKFKEIFPRYYSDRILGPILGGRESVENEKDYLKKLMFNVFGEDENGEGWQLWAHLPSTAHGLSMLNPIRVQEQTGPLVKVAANLFFGINPETGDKIPGASLQNSFSRAESILKGLLPQIISGTLPNNLLPLAKEQLEKHSKVWAEEMSGVGMSPELSKVLMGYSKTQKAQDRYKQAWIKTASLGIMGGTKAGVDVLLRAIARHKEDTRTVQSEIKALVASGVNPEVIAKKAERLFSESADALMKNVNLYDEYTKRMEKVGAAPSSEIEPELMTPEEEEAIPEAPLEETEPADPQEEDAAETSAILQDLRSGRMPAQSISDAQPIEPIMVGDKSVMVFKGLNNSEDLERGFNEVYNDFRRENPQTAEKRMKDFIETMKQENPKIWQDMMNGMREIYLPPQKLEVGPGRLPAGEMQ
jgi:hypothetical protein